MKLTLLSLAVAFLFISCKKDKVEPDWRDQFTGSFQGLSTFRDYTFESEFRSTYIANVSVMKDTESADGLVITRKKVIDYVPGQVGNQYYDFEYSYVVKVSGDGNVVVPKQIINLLNMVLPSNEIGYETDPQVAGMPTYSTGRYSGDTLVIKLVFADKNRIDSTVLRKL